MNIIGLLERASGIAQGEVDAVAFLDQLVEILGFPGEGLFQEPEEVFARRPFVPIPELDVVPPLSGGIFYNNAEVAVAELVLINHFAVHILIPEHIQD